MGVTRFFIVTISLLAFVEWGSFSPFKTFGFHCNDPKLGFKNESETISNGLLLFVSFVIPYFIFFIIGWYSNSDTSSNKTLIKTSWFRKAHFWYLKYLHGLCFTFLVTEILKIMAGEPRPHFLDTCRPLEAVNCTAGQYFSKYTCTSLLKPNMISDSYKSFPSGHASFSFYTATFLVIYFSEMVRTDSLFFLNLMHLLCISWALLCSITRITDHRHHWWDVLSGCILGVSISLYFYLYRPKHTGSKKFNDERSRSFDQKFINSK